jgi:hypothetical protein
VTTAAARQLPTLPASAELAATWAKWEDFTHASTDAEVDAMVALLMAAPLRTQVGDLIVNTGGWTKEQAAALKAPEGTPEWCAELDATPHVRVTLTDDGGPAARHAWCDDADHDGLPWVRYEYWTTEGTDHAIRRHGFVCSVPTCRKLTQTG